MNTISSSALREFWHAESVRLGFDWASIIVDQLRDADDADVRMASS